MSEKELLYIEDALGHIVNMQDYLTNHIELVEDENFKKVLTDLSKTNKEVYKKFYKKLEKQEG